MKIRQVRATGEVDRAVRGNDDPVRLARRDTNALRAVFEIAERWGLTGPEQVKLLGTQTRTLFAWKAAARGEGLNSALSRDTVERLSYVLGIWKALAILFPEPAHRIHWLNAPNTGTVFAGQPPRARLLAGNVGDLYAVRSYLDGWRG